MVAVIAVDGPAGSGKSSVCKGVAARLGYRYLDTGAMYRAMTWATLQAGLDPSDESAVAELAGIAEISSGTDPLGPTIHVDGVDVAEPIRSAEVTAAVSAVSSVAQVRERLVSIQRGEVDRAQQDGHGIVVEGRDIGSVVLPDAHLKIFLTADPAVRALRRAKEQAGGASVQEQSVVATEEALKKRDAIDSTRTVSPMTQAPDAVVVDTSLLTLEEVIDRVCDLVRERTS
jgi:cytidylate kinase